VQYRTIGRTGVHASTLSLGAMSFGALGNRDHDDCVRIIHRALDAGINLVDTADVYSQGESEVIVGKALAGRRDDVVLATKCFWPMGSASGGNDPNRAGGSRRWIVRALEESLARLGTDHVDIYYLHKPDTRTDWEESLGAMTDLVAQGKVRMVGVSTFPGDFLVETHWVASERGLVRPRVEQPPYSVLARGIEREVLPVCERYGMGVLVWGPLNSGWLTGKYTRGATAPEGSRAERWAARQGRAWNLEREPVQRKHDAVDALTALAAEAGLSLSHLALAFTLAHPAVTSTIIGPRTMAQLDDLLGAADLHLGADVLDAIDAIVPPGVNLDHDADSGWIPPWLTDASQRRRRTTD
jgi:aryl-alcohol dehydrogenase-like predicted oxidoreductase